MTTLATLLADRARACPEAVAMYYPTGREAGGETAFARLRFRELDERVGALARGLLRHGVLPGMKVAVLVRPGPDLTSTMFALFRIGAVPVLIDPGIDRRALRQCLDEAAPEAFIGIAVAHLARWLLGWARASVRIALLAGPRLGLRLKTLAEVMADGRSGGLPEVTDDELAAVVYTSGSTGVPKGVEYRHRMFVAQIGLFQQVFGFRPGQAILQTFPPFALFDPALGTTTVVPRMDPTRPARADPEELIRTIEGFGIKTMFGSPALLATLSRGVRARGAGPRGLRRILSAGAPVSPELVSEVFGWGGDELCVYTPYGATEALPVAVIEGRELLGEVRARTAAGGGICVGRPLAGNEVRILAIADAPIATVDRARWLGQGEIGEIVVRGPSVTLAYHGRPEQTALAKIADPDGTWHRMGDVGYVDEAGRLWYCGRKSQRVVTAGGTLYTECIEQCVNVAPGIRRSALVGVGPACRQRPLLWLEREEGAAPLHRLLPAVRERLAEAGLHHIELREHPGFPVDIRHNSKIGRERLAREADSRQRRGTAT